MMTTNNKWVKLASVEAEGNADLVIVHMVSGAIDQLNFSMLLEPEEALGLAADLMKCTYSLARLARKRNK